MTLYGTVETEDSPVTLASIPYAKWKPLYRASRDIKSPIQVWLADLKHYDIRISDSLSESDDSSNSSSDADADAESLNDS